MSSKQEHLTSDNVEPEAAYSLPSEEEKLLEETKLLRDTLDLLWNKAMEQKKICTELQQQNNYLQDYISNLMTSSNVLEK